MIFLDQKRSKNLIDGRFCNKTYSLEKKWRFFQKLESLLKDNIDPNILDPSKILVQQI